MTYLSTLSLPGKCSAFKICVVAFLACGVLSCRPKKQDASIGYKSMHFNSLIKTIEDCKSLNTDSVINCTSQKFNIDALEGINSEIWHHYVNANALLHARQYKESIHTIDAALKKTENEFSLVERAYLLMLRGLVFTITREDLSAIEDYYNAADIYIQLGLYQNTAECYLAMTNIQYSSGNYQYCVENGKLTIDFLKRSNSMNKKDSTRLMSVYNTLGLAYLKYNMLDSAIHYFNSSIEMAENLHNEFWEGLVNGNLSTLLLTNGQLEEAEEKTKIDLLISLKYKEHGSAAGALLILGDIARIKNDYKKVELYYDSSLQIITKLGDQKLLGKYYLSIASYELEKQQYKKAAEFFQNHIEIRDSLQRVSMNDQLNDIQNRKKMERHLSDINLLMVENELKTKQVRIWQVSIFGSICFVVLLSILFDIKRRNNELLKKVNDNLQNSIQQRTNELTKTNQELDTYLYRASHDIRRPILSIIGLTKIGQLTKKISDSRDIYYKIASTAKEMDNMLSKLQTAYGLNKLEVEYSKVDLNNLLEDLTTDLKQIHPSIEFNLHKSTSAVVESDPDLLNLIFVNLLENACIFRSANPVITIFIQIEEEVAMVKIVDNGIGIPKDYLNDIFGLYTRFSPMSVGSGLGLHLVKQALNKLNGNIEVDSIVAKGTQFIIKIPKEINTLSNSNKT